jgi:hypothetical protein
VAGVAPADRWAPLPPIRVDHLYVLLALSTTTVAISLIPVPPNDLWWHLRVGQLIAEEGIIPHTNLFAWSVPRDTPFVYAAWLGDRLYYEIFAHGGTSLVIFTRNLLALATLSLVGLEAQRRSGSWKLAGLAVGLAGAMTMSNIMVRPQNWSWPCFALFALILFRFADRQLRPVWLVSLPLLMVFWVNAHGAFALGLLLVAGVIAGESVRHALREPDAAGSGAPSTGAGGDKPPPLRPGAGGDTTLTRTELALLYVAGLGTLLATLANPQGLDIFQYVQTILSAPPVQRMIPEWQPPTPSGFPNIAFFVSILLLLAAFAYGRRRATPTTLLVTCGFLWLAWSAVRNLFWYALIAPPVLVGCLGKQPAPGATPTFPRQSGLANGLLAAAMIAPMIAVQPWFVRSLPLPDGYFQQMLAAPAPPLLWTETPFAATEFLRTNPGGKLFNDVAFGSYLIFALPEQPVFVDPRVELFPLRQWQDYAEISDGGRSLELLAHYGIDRAFVNLQTQAALSRALQASGTWRREYADRFSEIWRLGH